MENLILVKLEESKTNRKNKIKELERYNKGDYWYAYTSGIIAGIEHEIRTLEEVLREHERNI